jgi:hypothetical protein
LLLPLRIACSLHGSILVRQPDAAARARPPLQKVDRRSTSCALALRLVQRGSVSPFRQKATSEAYAPRPKAWPWQGWSWFAVSAFLRFGVSFLRGEIVRIRFR